MAQGKVEHYTHGLVTRTVEGWAEAVGISYTAMAKRIKNWGLEKAVTTPPRDYTEHGDLTGKRFGLLVVTARAGAIKHHPAWSVVCDCGGTHRTTCYGLVSGKTISCGCRRGGCRRGPHLKKEAASG